MTDPWTQPMTPEEFKEYYDEGIKGLQKRCKYSECNKVAEFPRDHCSNRCRNRQIRKVARELEEILESKGL